MASTPDRITPTENELIEAAAAETAKEAAMLPRNDKEQFDALIQQGARRHHFAGEKLQKYSDRVMAKVVERERNLKTASEKTVFDKYEGRIVRANGQYVPVGIDEDFEFKERYGRWWQRITRTTIHREGLNDLIDEVMSTEQMIRERQAELEILKAAQKTRRECIKNAAKMWNERRKHKNNWVLSSGVIDALRSTFAQRRMALDAFENANDDLKRKSESIESKRKALERIMKKIKEFQKSGEKRFDENFGPELKKLRENHRSDPRLPDYEARLQDLRMRVRKFGADNHIIHFEYYLNKELQLKPDAVIDHVQFDAGFTDSGEKIYTPPATAVETATEKLKMEQWWKKVFGETLRDASSFIAQLRQRNALSLVEIIDDDISDEEVAALKFFFKGEVDGRQVLPQSRAFKLEVGTVAAQLPLVKDYMKKAGNEDTLKKIFYLFAKKWKQQEAKDFAFAFPYILPEAQARGGDYMDLAENSNKDAEIRSARKLCEEFVDPPPTNDQVVNFHDRMKNEFRHQTLEILSDDKYRSVLRFFCFGEIAGNRVDALPNDSLIVRNGDEVGNFLIRAVRFYELTPDQFMVNQVLMAFVEEMGTGRTVYDLDQGRFETILRRLEAQKTANTQKIKNKEVAKQYIEFFLAQDVYDRLDATQQREIDEERVELEHGTIKRGEKDLIEAFLRMKKITDEKLFNSTVNEFLNDLKDLLNKAKLPIRVETQSKSWVYEDLAAEFALSEAQHKRGNITAAVNPLTSKGTRGEILNRKFGKELHALWRDPTVKPLIQDLLRKTTLTTIAVITEKMLDENYPDLLDLGKNIQKILAAPQTTTSTSTSTGASP